MKTDMTQMQQDIVNLFSGIGEHTYLDLLPKAQNERLGSYVLIQLRSQIRDFGAYKETTLTVYAVARNRAGGMSNGTELDRMSNEIMSRIPYRGDSYSIISPQVTPWRGMTGFSYATITATLRIE